MNLKTMCSVLTKVQNNVKNVAKEMNIVVRTLEIVRDHGLTTQDLLMYDTVPSCLVFDDEEMMKKPTKSILIKE